MNLKPFFDKYKQLVRQADAAFEKIQNNYPECVRCKEGCADCCHALFDLTLVEALYINSFFDERFPDGSARRSLLDRADEADRQIHRLKRKAYQALEAGKTEQEILADIAQQRVRCPCLNDEDRCSIYDARPITCRIYGAPTVIGGKAHTCGVSEFKEGERYPTFRLDAIYQQLYDISKELSNAINSRFSGLAEMLVPLSMALLTEYSEDYLGVRGRCEVSEEAPSKEQK